jgi:hypothetical protein
MVDECRTRLGEVGEQIRKGGREGEGCAEGRVKGDMDASIEGVDNNAVTRNEYLTDVDCISRLRVGIQYMR